jgi:Flp pilus assembly protein TadD
MASVESNEDRHAVPRLRSFSFATQLGELNSIKPAAENPFTAAMLQDTLDDWNREPSISVAADLVSTAIVLDQKELARDAARFLIEQKDAPPGARKMAAICLGEGDPTEIAPGVKSVHAEQFDVDHLRDQIHRTRIQLRLYPADPVLWTNLACLYLSLGQNRQARRTVRAALSLAPENRFVLRSASRILLHINEGDEGRAVLLRSANLKSDPWVLSAEISIAAAIRAKSDQISLAQKWVEGQKFSPFDISELAVELATIQAIGGNTWAGKKCLRRALEKPCENAMAQAAWLARIPGMPGVSEQITTSYEANAWITRRTGQLRQSMLQTKHWLNDQPFSGRPAKAGSFIASRINRHDEGVKFAEQGLLCNPDDAMLLNNLAFSSARNGDVKKAREALNKTRAADLTPRDNNVLTATTGLVAFREGNVQQGRMLYVQAIKWFREKGEISEAVALTYHAMEELRARTPDAQKLRDFALERGKKLLHDPEDTILTKQLEDFGKNDDSPNAPAPSLMIK